MSTTLKTRVSETDSDPVVEPPFLAKTVVKQIATAQRRFYIQQFLRTLGIAWTIAFSITLVGVLLPKVWYFPIREAQWNLLWLLIPAFLGWGAALLVAWFRTPDPAKMATEIDLRMKLRERFSSAIAMTPSQRNTAMGLAVMHDAEKTALKLDVRDSFSVAPKRGLLWPLIPLLLAVGLTSLPNANARIQSTEEDEYDESLIRDARQLADRIAEQSKMRYDKLSELEDADEELIDFYKRLEQQAKELRDRSSNDPKKMLSDLNKLRSELDQQRERLGTSESIRKSLEGLTSKEPGPASEMMKALQEGNYEAASTELESILDSLKNDRFSEEETKQLAKQLDQLEKAMREKIAEHEAKKAELERQLENAKESGDSQRVAQLERELAAAQGLDGQMQEMQEMAELLQAAQNSLEEGDADAAGQALQELKEKANQIGQQAEALQELDSLSELSQGGNQAQGMNQQQNQFNQGNQKQQPSNDWGTGTHQGERDEDEIEAVTFDAQLRMKAQPGETLYGGAIGGANRKGITREAIQEAVLNPELEEDRALETIMLPKKQQNQSRDYFDQLRDGK